MVTRIDVILIAAACALLSGCKMDFNRFARGEPIPGDASRFDPIGAIPELRKGLDASYRLQRFDGLGIRADGTIDMTNDTFDPEVTYRFVRSIDPPAKQPPIGAGGTGAKEWHRETRIIVERPGYHETYRSGGTRKGYHSKGVQRRELDPEAGTALAAGTPACSLADLWRVATEKGAPEGAVAEVGFSSRGYELEIAGTGIDLSFGPDCRLRD